MRTKMIAVAAFAGALMASSSAFAEGGTGMQHCKRPLITRVASVALAKQPTLVQSVPAPRKPL